MLHENMIKLLVDTVTFIFIFCCRVSAISFTCKMHNKIIHILYPLVNSERTDFYITTRNILLNKTLDHKKCQTKDAKLWCEWIYDKEFRHFNKSFVIELFKENKTVTKEHFPRIFDCFSNPLQQLSIADETLYWKTSTLYDMTTGVRRVFILDINGNTVNNNIIKSQCNNKWCSYKLPSTPTPRKNVCLTLDFDNIPTTKCLSIDSPKEKLGKEEKNILIPVFSGILATAFLVMIVIVVSIRNKWWKRTDRGMAGSTDLLPRSSFTDDNIITPQNHYESIESILDLQTLNKHGTYLQMKKPSNILTEKT